MDQAPKGGCIDRWCLHANVVGGFTRDDSLGNSRIAPGTAKVFWPLMLLQKYFVSRIFRMYEIFLLEYSVQYEIFSRIFRTIRNIFKNNPYDTKYSCQKYFVYEIFLTCLGTIKTQINHSKYGQNAMQNTMYTRHRHTRPSRGSPGPRESQRTRPPPCPRRCEYMRS